MGPTARHPAAGPQKGQPGSGKPCLGRLKRRPEFLRVASEGRKWSMPGLVLQASRRSPDDSCTPDGSCTTESAPARVGFTASRKVGGAVERNRAKRRLRALAAELLAAKARGCMDYVLIGRQATVTRPYALLKADLAEALERVHRPAGGARTARR